MAIFDGRGYVSKPEAKTSAGGKAYSKFCLGVKQKQKDGSFTWGNYFVTDFKNPSPPKAKAFVTVKGFITVKEVEKDGQRRTYVEINAQELEVAPPFEGGSDAPEAEPPAKKPVAQSQEKEPWEEDE